MNARDDADSARRRAVIAKRLLTGDCILNVPSRPLAVWGGDDDGDELLWAARQALIIVGTDGTGKTTIAGNLVQARLGLTNKVLGQKVRPGERNVLVLLMDRPDQAMAAYKRLFKNCDKDRLHGRLRVWRGPPLKDLARFPEMLAEYCEAADADTCIVDSLKDAALNLSEDETGSGWNRARQLAIEQARVELCELTHPRKVLDGKQPKLDDLYGSRWITAGAGSVLLLHGEAGDPVVKLVHLKPVLETAGPWEVTFDARTGLASISHDVDLLDCIGKLGRDGITAVQAARLLYRSERPSKADVVRARRKLNSHCQADPPRLIERSGSHGGSANRGVATWVLAA